LSHLTARLLGGEGAANVTRALARLETALDGGVDGIGHLGKAELPATHEAKRLKHADRIRNALSGNVWCRSRDGLVDADR
jgi:hypothetical protein